jgi:hypothetical protein
MIFFFIRPPVPGGSCNGGSRRFKPRRKASGHQARLRGLRATHPGSLLKDHKGRRTGRGRMIFYFFIRPPARGSRRFMIFFFLTRARLLPAREGGLGGAAFRRGLNRRLPPRRYPDEMGKDHQPRRKAGLARSGRRPTRATRYGVSWLKKETIIRARARSDVLGWRCTSSGFYWKRGSCSQAGWVTRRVGRVSYMNSATMRPLTAMMAAANQKPASRPNASATPPMASPPKA